MYAYQTDTSHFQPNHQAPSATVFDWIKSKLEARRARLTQAREIGCLENLDRSTLEDMGIDATTRGGTLSSLARFNPHVIAINIFAR